MSEFEEVISYVQERSEKLSSLGMAGLLIDIRKKYDSLSDTEFCDIVAEVIKLKSSEKFMINTYKKFHKKMIKLIGDDKVEQMEQYIMQKYSFFSGEEILYKCRASITFLKKHGPFIRDDKIKVGPGRIYVTNSRIIAHGNLSTGSIGMFLVAGWLGYAAAGTKMASKFEKQQKSMSSEERGCFGYQFPISNLHDLRVRGNQIVYNVTQDKEVITITISPYLKEDINTLSEILRTKEIKYCTHCKTAILNQDQKFCVECGKEL